MSPYAQLLTDLNRYSAIRPGLDVIQRLLEALGNPHLAYSAIHVAGTNGKGSVTWKMAAALRAQGRRVGLYTSPHIASVRERMRIDGELIDEKHLVEVGREVLAAAQGQATFFELLTAMGFLAFQRMGVEIAMVEVGMGGRLDATNCVQPLLTVITSIGLDHTEVLGTDLNSIAREKAGIIKSGVPLVLGPGAVYRPILDRAVQLGAPMTLVPPPLDWSFDAENRAIVRRCAQLLGVPALGLETRPPCRMEQFPSGVILDVAHNPHGLRALRRSLPDGYDQVVVGMSRSKDLVGCFQELGTWAKGIHLVSLPHPRLATLDELERAAASAGVAIASRHFNATSALQAAGRCVVCGSFFIMADMREALGASQIRDPFDVQEIGATPVQMTMAPASR